MSDIAELLEKLEKAKHNVRYLLDHANALVDFHGLDYWAGRVTILREAIKESL